ncbi:hypothetical protein [Symbioplanes lichenis]|uniref:hypothetical protein n=1 Tax=Symbioplanes lichenis TaxID=1629072 RepID=UPI00273924EE|nr:hypothetical protein [Actinoplanes lichenis]
MNPSHEPEPVYLYGPPPDTAPALPEPVAEPRARSRRSWQRAAVVAAAIIAAMAVAGALLGLLWAWVAPDVPVINTGAAVVVNDPSPEEYIAADGWFTLIAFAFGLVAALVAWLVLRRDRGPAVLLGVTLGGLASTVVMWQAGRLIGLSAWNSWQDSSQPGDTFQRPPDLHAHGALLVAAFAAVIVTTLLAGWSNDPELDQPGAKPGYGRDYPPVEPSGGLFPAEGTEPGPSPAGPSGSATESPDSSGSTAGR